MGTITLGSGLFALACKSGASIGTWNENKLLMSIVEEPITF